MNTLIVFSFNLVIPHCQILTVFILGVLPNFKKRRMDLANNSYNSNTLFILKKKNQFLKVHDYTAFWLKELL